MNRHNRPSVYWDASTRTLLKQVKRACQ
uniref:Uncharacterized protein n=1 Tax=Anopheles arabiensis TaxID=7173 RepID=A0A182IGY8_ANOAR